MTQELIFNVWGDALYLPTPVEKVGEMLFKREDKFAPLGYGGVNGSKLRQLIWLVKDFVESNPKARRLVSGAVGNSPQHLMAAVVCKHYGIEYIGISGADFNSTSFPTLQLALKYGAKMLKSKVGYARTLEKKAFDLSDEDTYVMETNIVVNNPRNPPDKARRFHRIGAAQVVNLPESVEHLIIPCGSATSTISVFYGLAVNGLKNIKKITLMGIGNIGSRNLGFIWERLSFMGIDARAVRKVQTGYHNLNGEGYCKYEDWMPFSYHGIDFHPRYEGKCMNYISEKHPEYFDEKTLFWIVGSEPKF